MGGSLSGVTQDSGWAVREAVDIFHTATDAWDKRFTSHSTVVRTCTISAGTIGTTDFEFTPDQKQWLLQAGRDGAKSFLDNYDPSLYRNNVRPATRRPPVTTEVSAPPPRRLRRCQ